MAARARPSTGGLGVGAMRILLVSSMWPGPDDPDYGVFVAQVSDALQAMGHEILPAVIDHRGGGKGKQGRLAIDALRHAVQADPDVVYAHFLLPAGGIAALAALAGRAPLVLTAHGRDVRNVAENAGIRMATGLAVRRSKAVIAVSGWLRDELHRELPESRHKTEVIDCGVDMMRFAPRDQAKAREALGLTNLPGSLVVYVGGLDERKNVVRLRDAVLGMPSATLLAVGDGPLRSELSASDKIRAVGRVPHDEVPAYMAAADVVALPSIVEPFGQVVLEAMAMQRPVLATQIGGPAELVTAATGALADPYDVASIRAGLERAIALGVPNPAGRTVAAEHDLSVQVARIEAVLQRVAS
jgi:glycosyltransferase involved in cell wall biosynthesis